MKEDTTQIPRIPFFLKLKIVLIPGWEFKVSKNRINYTSLCSCTHHVIKSHGSRDYKSYLQPNEGLLFPILIKGTYMQTISIMSALLHSAGGNYRYTGHTRTPD